MVRSETSVGIKTFEEQEIRSTSITLMTSFTNDALKASLIPGIIFWNHFGLNWGQSGVPRAIHLVHHLRGRVYSERIVANSPKQHFRAQ